MKKTIIQISLSVFPSGIVLFKTYQKPGLHEKEPLFGMGDKNLDGQENILTLLLSPLRK